MFIPRGRTRRRCCSSSVRCHGRSEAARPGRRSTTGKPSAASPKRHGRSTARSGFPSTWLALSHSRSRAGQGLWCWRFPRTCLPRTPRSRTHCPSRSPDPPRATVTSNACASSSPRASAHSSWWARVAGRSRPGRTFSRSARRTSYRLPVPSGARISWTTTRRATSEFSGSRWTSASRPAPRRGPRGRDRRPAR